MRRLKIILVFIATVFTSVIIGASNVSAQTVNDVKEKFVRYGFYTCYSGSAYMESSVKAGAFSSSVSGAADGISMRDTLFKTDDAIVGLPPNYLGDNDEYSCVDFLANVTAQGTGAQTGAQAINDKSKTAAEAAAKLTELGYEGLNSSENACMTFIFANASTTNAGDSNEQTSLTLCAKVDGTDRNIQGDIYLADKKNPDGNSNLIFDTTSSTIKLNGEGPGSQVISAKYEVGNKFDNIMDALDLNLQKYKRGENSEGLTIATVGGGMYIYYNRSGIITNSEEGKQYSKKTTSYIDAYKNLREVNSYGTNTFNKEEQAALYQDYLVSFYGVRTANCSAGGEPSSNGLVVGNPDSVLGYHKSKIYGSDGKIKTCYIEANEAAASKKVFGVTKIGNSSVPSMVKVDGRVGLLDIIKWMNENAPDEISAELAGSIGEAAPGTAGAEDGDSAGGSDTKSCFDGAGALGWIVCTVLEGIGNATTTIYENYIEPALTIDANLFSVGGERGAYASWQIFQTFANIIFALMILVVIFSQLTGVGIDNYGIKRILPRLIVSAVLINLSFIICQLAVDLSNVLGVSLKNLFSNIGPEVGGTGVSGGAGGHFFSAFVVIIGALATAGAILSMGIGIIIPILLGALSGLIAVFFLFLTLSARQAAIVVLTIISPVAFVLYMLPNTKKYFDKLVSIFVALLVVFPICGLLIGGGDFASRAILEAGGVAANNTSSSGNLFFQLSAMLVGIVPIFFIPTLVRSSLSALGNLGAKINGIGSSIRGRATGAARGGLDRSRLGASAKEYQQNRERRINLRRAEGTVNRLNRRRGRGRPMSDAQIRRLAQNQSAIEKFGNEDLAARTSLAMSDFGAVSEDRIREEWRNAFESGDGDQLKAITGVMQSRFGSNAAKFIGDDLERLENEGLNIGNSINAQRSLSSLQEFANNDSKFAGDLKSKAFDAHAMITGGGKDSSGNFHNLSYFSNAQNVKTGAGKLDTIEDISTQSTGAIRRAVAGGSITGEQAAAVISSTDQRIQSGIASDAGKRDELMKARITNDGTTYSVKDRVEAAQADKARAEQKAKFEREEAELQIQHHDDAMAIGKTQLTAGSATFDGYAVPAGFTSAGDPIQNADGHWIYSDKVTGRQWNATTGRYVREDPNSPIVLN